MADGYEHFDKSLESQEGAGGSSFIIGLLTGTVLGAGLGMLFAPRSGSELRSKLSEQAGSMASEGYRRASESAGHWAEKGRDMYQKASDAVAKGTDEAKRYVRDAGKEGTTTASSAFDSGSSYAAGSAYGSGSETLRGSGSEEIRGSDRDPLTPRRP
jgi:gas vesicle protein